MKEIRADNIIVESDYHLPMGKLKLVVLFIFILSLGFVFTFPIKKIANFYFQQALAKAGNCQIDYKDYQTTFLFPGIELKDVNIPNNCIKRGQPKINFSKIGISFKGISFSPLAPVIGIRIYQSDFDIGASIVSNGTKHLIDINESDLAAGKLVMLIEQLTQATVPSLKGKLDVELSAQVENEQLLALNLDLNSKDFQLPAQSISGFDIPQMNLKTLEILINGEGKKVLIEKIAIGDDSAPIKVTGKGSLLANLKFFDSSELDLDLDLSLSKEILSQYSIIGIALGGFKKSEGKFSFKLKGPINSVTPRAK
jgi:type II secretion system protein N